MLVRGTYIKILLSLSLHVFSYAAETLKKGSLGKITHLIVSKKVEGRGGDREGEGRAFLEN
jgi:hypothetical protein